ncbi:ABC transporter ATP-binding protein [Oscillospiraceae bacterium WX1]
MVIDINDVGKRFGHLRVLSGISLTAQPGEILCLLGPSGAGKTTLIRLITGALCPDGGTITYDGEKIPTMASIRHIGYMPQNDAVYNDITGLDNLLFFGRLYGLKGARLKDAAARMLTLVNLTDDQNKLVCNYSGGMKKRLSLAVALLHDPDILVLDEPTVGIDPLLRQTIWDKFNDLAARGKTIIISTHVMDEADKCKKAALLYQGLLIEHDTVAALKAKTASGSLEELFFMAGKAGAAE